MERWQSGLMRSLGKRVRANTLRGFESLPLRHNKQTYLTCYLSHDPVTLVYFSNKVLC